MKIDIDKYLVQQVAMIIGLGCVIYLVWFLISSAVSSYKTDRACERSCGTLKSQILNDRCHCATAAGWTPAGKAHWVDRKVKGRR